MTAKPFGVIRRAIILCIALCFLGGAAAIAVPLGSGRELPQDDVYAIYFLAGCLGFIGLTLAWIFLDMGRKNRRAATADDILGAALPHVLNLGDAPDLDGPADGSID